MFNDIGYNFDNVGFGPDFDSVADCIFERNSVIASSVISLDGIIFVDTVMCFVVGKCNIAGSEIGDSKIFCKSFFKL